MDIDMKNGWLSGSRGTTEQDFKEIFYRLFPCFVSLVMPRMANKFHRFSFHTFKAT